MKKKSILYCFLLFIGISTRITVGAQAVNIKDSLALVDLYNSTNGSGWNNNTNWLKGPVNTWYGITVSNRRVTKIVIYANNLVGTIPASVGELQAVNFLDLSFNQLNGAIPIEIGKLINLTILLLNENQLSGNIPAELTNLLLLEHLDLSINLLDGNIPASIGNLSALKVLHLSENNLSGIIPTEIAKLSYLYELYLDYNHLTGKIPSALGNLDLLYLGLDYNQLTGEIPSELGNMKRLMGLTLSNNQLSGVIPPEINMVGLYILNLSHNKLSGDIPAWWFNDWSYLDLSYNKFTFQGLELVAKNYPAAIYYTQKRIPIQVNKNSLYVSAGGTLSNNTYTWQMIEQPGKVVITADSVLHPVRSGTYYVKITNSIATGLILKSDTINYIAPVMPSKTNLTSYELQTNNNNNKAQKFSVYPNPAKEMLHIQTNSNTLFSLVNQAGRVVLTKNINGKGTINVKGMTAGLYYLKSNTTGDVQKVFIVQ